MAIIPVGAPGVGTQPGSIVYAVDTQSARLEGNALSRLGDSITDAANMLSDINQRKSARVTAARVKRGEEELENYIIQEKNKFMTQASKDQLAGNKPIEFINTKGREFMNKYMYDNDFTDDEKMLFGSSGVGVINRYGSSTLVDATKALDAVQENEEIELIGAMSKTIADSFSTKGAKIITPDDKFAEIADYVNKDPLLANYEKPAKARQLQARLAKSMVDTVRFRGNPKEAKQLLDTYRSFFTNEEYEKNANAIQADFNQKVSTEYTELLRNEKQYEKEKKSLQASIIGDFVLKAESAQGRNATNLRQFKQAAQQQLLAAGIIDKEDAEFIGKYVPGIRKEADSFFQANIYDEYFRSNRADAAAIAIDKAKKQHRKGELSSPALKEIIEDISRASAYRRDRRTDRAFDLTKQILTETLAAARAAGKDPTDVSVQLGHAAYIRVAKEIMSQFEKTGDVDFDTLRVVQEKALNQVAPAPLAGNANAGSVRTKINKINELREQAKNSKDRQRRIELLRNIKILENQIRLEQEINPQRNNTTGTRRQGDR